MSSIPARLRAIADELERKPHEMVPPDRGIRWHWVQHRSGIPTPWQWDASCDRWCDCDGVWRSPQEALTQGYRWIAPCHPPATGEIV